MHQVFRCMQGMLRVSYIASGFFQVASKNTQPPACTSSRIRYHNGPQGHLSTLRLCSGINSKIHFAWFYAVNRGSLCRMNFVTPHPRPGDCSSHIKRRSSGAFPHAPLQIQMYAVTRLENILHACIRIVKDRSCPPSQSNFY